MMVAKKQMKNDQIIVWKCEKCKKLYELSFFQKFNCRRDNISTCDCGHVDEHITFSPMDHWKFYEKKENYNIKN